MKNSSNNSTESCKAQHLIEAACALASLAGPAAEQAPAPNVVASDETVERRNFAQPRLIPEKPAHGVPRAHIPDCTVGKVRKEETRTKKFPEKLMEIISTPHYSDAITWLPHGRSFYITNTVAFTKRVLPEHFRGACQFPSFVRRLYRWGFREISKGPDAESFYHENFRRGDWERCRKIVPTREVRDGCPEMHNGICATEKLIGQKGNSKGGKGKNDCDNDGIEEDRSLFRTDRQRIAVGRAPRGIKPQLPQLQQQQRQIIRATAATTRSPPQQVQKVISLACNPIHERMELDHVSSALRMAQDRRDLLLAKKFALQRQVSELQCRKMNIRRLRHNIPPAEHHFSLAIDQDDMNSMHTRHPTSHSALRIPSMNGGVQPLTRLNKVGGATSKHKLLRSRLALASAAGRDTGVALQLMHDPLSAHEGKIIKKAIEVLHRDEVI